MISAEQVILDNIIFSRIENIKIMIRLNIEVETDYDFSLNFNTPNKALEYVINKFEGGYTMKVDFYQNENDVVEYIVDFLESIKIVSSKDWHEEDLRKGVSGYKKILKEKGLQSCGDILGGNWKFLISLDRMNVEHYI